MTSPSLDGPPELRGSTSRLLSAPALVPKLGWTLLLALTERIRARGPITAPTGVTLDEEGRLVELRCDAAPLILDGTADRGWRTPTHAGELPDATAELFDLFLPLCVGTSAEHLVLAHLAQSLDGRVATNSGSSQFISGREDLTHTHRLRALFDAVLVGARTVEHDDPRLTTRLAPGPNPTRVIVDPSGRLPNTHRVFCQDDAPTVLVRGPGSFHAPSHVDVLQLDADKGWIEAPRLLDALADRGLRRIFIEGGGITVSGFLEARALDRLHITVAPVLLGSGRPALKLPEIDTLDEAMRVSCRHFALGPDVLFDCPLPRRR